MVISRMGDVGRAAGAAQAKDQHSRRRRTSLSSRPGAPDRRRVTLVRFDQPGDLPNVDFVQGQARRQP
jgi:hypothetical protein